MTVTLGRGTARVGMSAQSRTQRGPRVHRLTEDIPTGEQQRLRWAATLTPHTHPQPTGFWEQGPRDSD